MSAPSPAAAGRSALVVVAAALGASVASGAAVGWGQAEGLPAARAAGALLALAGALLLSAAALRIAHRPFLVPMPPALALVVVGAALGLVGAGDPRPRATAAYLATAVIAVVACQLAAALPPRAVLSGAVVALGGMAALALGAAGLGLTELEPRAADGSGRLTWPFEHPNFLGAYMAIMIAPALAAAVIARGRLVRVASAGAVVLGLVALGLSQSRAAWLGALAALAALAAYGVARRLVLVAVPLILVLSLPLTIPRLTAPDLGLENPRGGIWEDAVHQFLERPLTGVGIDNFARLASPQEVVFGTPTPQHAHSLYLNAAAEMGVVGAGAILVLLATAALAAHRTAAGAAGHFRVLGSALVAAVVALAVAGVLDSTFDDPLTAAAAWAVVGASAGALVARRRPDDGDRALGRGPSPP